MTDRNVGKILLKAAAAGVAVTVGVVGVPPAAAAAGLIIVAAGGAATVGLVGAGVYKYLSEAHDDKALSERDNSE